MGFAMLTLFSPHAVHCGSVAEMLGNKGFWPSVRLAPAQNAAELTPKQNRVGGGGPKRVGGCAYADFRGAGALKQTGRPYPW